MNRWLVSRLGLSILPGLILSGCAPRPELTPAPLTIEEHPLAGAPTLEPLTFTPLEGTQTSLLARHAQARAQIFPGTVEFVGPDPVISSLGELSDCTARLSTSTLAPPEQVVTVERDGQAVFTAPAGLPSPVLPLEGLWTYSGHWALELAFAAGEVWEGRIFVDGTPINPAQGYREAFGLQLLEGRPFYFYEREGRIGYSYDGFEVDLGYDQIPHYRCCSESVLNPIQAESMVAFFAEREGNWFYVELGPWDD